MYKRKTVTLVCDNNECLKKFERAKSEAKRNKSLRRKSYCCRSCQGKGNSANLKGGVGANKKRMSSVAKIRRDIESINYILLQDYFYGTSHKIKVGCEQGHVSYMKYHDLMRGHRCKKCRSKENMHSLDYVRKIVRDRDQGYALFSKTYNGIRSKIEVLCKEHGIFSTTFLRIKNGSGCPTCNPCGFNPQKKATLYYLEVLHYGRLYYKIGITNLSVQKRYARKSDQKKITVLGEWDYQYGKNCRDEEQRIIGKFRDYLYKGTATVLEGAAGNAELFTENVLQL